MSVTLRALLVVLSLVFFAAVVRLVARGRLQLKYSLLWMLLSIVMLLCALFPGLVARIAYLVGIQTPSNLVFLAGLGLLMVICMSLTIIVSWQTNDIRLLVQSVALLEKRVKELEDRCERPTE